MPEYQPLRQGEARKVFTVDHVSLGTQPLCALARSSVWGRSCGFTFFPSLAPKGRRSMALYPPLRGHLALQVLCSNALQSLHFSWGSLRAK